MIGDIFFSLLWLALFLIGAAGIGAFWLARGAARKFSALGPLRRLQRASRRPALPERDDQEGSDLLAYPRKLEALEQRLGERHRAVEDQMQLLEARCAEMDAKAGREELARKYRDDLRLLNARAGSMRRVLGMVWKTRAVLLFRAHLALSARRRPDLGRLPDPLAPSLDLRSAQQAFHEAARAVKLYMNLLRERAAELPSTRPDPPSGADADAATRAIVDREEDRTSRAHLTLVDDMDRLCDNLTWLGDHLASRATLDGGDAGAGDSGSPDSGPLLEEVERALQELSGLARSMDPALADSAVHNLAVDIGRLEEAGLEADAEAAARLEVENLLRETQTPPREIRT